MLVEACIGLARGESCNSGLERRQALTGFQRRGSEKDGGNPNGTWMPAQSGKDALRDPDGGSHPCETSETTCCASHFMLLSMRTSVGMGTTASLSSQGHG